MLISVLTIYDICLRTSNPLRREEKWGLNTSSLSVCLFGYSRFVQHSPLAVITNIWIHRHSTMQFHNHTSKNASYASYRNPYSRSLTGLISLAVWTDIKISLFKISLVLIFEHFLLAKLNNRGWRNIHVLRLSKSIQYENQALLRGTREKRIVTDYKRRTSKL